MSRTRTIGPREERRNPLADSLPLERTWSDDHDTQLAALRVVLGLARRPVPYTEEAHS